MSDFTIIQDEDGPNVWVVIHDKNRQPEFKSWSGFAKSFEAMARKLSEFDGKGVAPSIGVAEQGKSLTLHAETGEGDAKRSINATIRDAGDGQSEVVVFTTNTPVEKGGLERMRETGAEAEAKLSRGVINWLLNNTQLSPDDFNAMFDAAKTAAGVEDKPAAPAKDDAAPAKPGA
ncbi:MAG: hypothetical protein Alpg2KO_09560 [Alphaproteobacteria bacterium]